MFCLFYIDITWTVIAPTTRSAHRQLMFLYEYYLLLVYTLLLVPLYYLRPPLCMRLKETDVLFEFLFRTPEREPSHYKKLKPSAAAQPYKQISVIDSTEQIKHTIVDTR